MKTTYPQPPSKSAPGRWNDPTANPAEDHWLVNTDKFVGDNDFKGGQYWTTHIWLHQRILHSMEIADYSLPFAANPEAQLTIRPCTNGRQLRRTGIEPVEFFNYSDLLGIGESGLQEELQNPTVLTRTYLTNLHGALLRLAPQFRPVAFILSYDDDNECVGYIADKQPELYERYCESKGLPTSKRKKSVRGFVSARLTESFLTE
jgi:hypothetical protein